jgi:tetratricopeptide (TPR) repeat protein
MDRETAALLERAGALRRAGRFDEAIAAYRALLERQPDLPDSWYNLGWLQRQARLYEAALDSYGEALERGVRDPEEIHVNRAVILSDHLARHDEAEAELEAALRVRPDYLPALLNLGNLYEDRGNREAAEGAYRRALNASPGDALALSRLAGVLKPDSKPAAELVERLRAAIRDERESPARADLGFALGRLLDGRGDFEEAFAAYEAANRASRESFPRYDREAHERFVDRLIATFPEPAKAAVEAAPSIFILGMFRSGSTLVERILAGHSRIAAGGELDLIPALSRRIDGYPEAVAAAGEDMLQAWREFYLAGLKACDGGAGIVTDKRPDNFLHLGADMPYALDLTGAAHWHAQYERLMAHWKRLYPNDIFDVDYDSLVREPEPLIRGLLDFLGLDWEEQLLDFHCRGGAVKTASVWQVREPLHARSSGRWKNYEPQLKRQLGRSFGA